MTLQRQLLLCFHREGVEKILEELNISSEDRAFGKTKIFIRSPKTVSWTMSLFWVGVGMKELGRGVVISWNNW